MWDEIDLSVVDEMTIPAHELESKCLEAGDLLICEGGEIGRAAIWNGQRPLMSFQNHLHRLRPIVRDIVPRFYVYFLQAAFKQFGIFEGAANKTTIPNLSRSRLASLEVPYPPLDVQRAITLALARVREVIALHRESIKCVESLKSAVMAQVFTRGLRGEPQKETDVGLIPESWDLARCEDLCELVTVGLVVKPASYYVKDGVPAFRSLNVREDRLETDNLVFVSKLDNETTLSKSRLTAGDVLVVRSGYPGTSCVVPREYDGANCIDLVIVRPKADLIDAHFLSRFFNSPAGRQQAMSAKHGLAQQHLNVGAVKRTMIPVPSDRSEQAEIANVLRAIDEKLELHKQKRNALESLFASLLSGLMTGDIAASRLNIIDEGVAEAAR